MNFHVFSFERKFKQQNWKKIRKCLPRVIISCYEFEKKDNEIAPLVNRYCTKLNQPIQNITPKNPQDSN